MKTLSKIAAVILFAVVGFIAVPASANDDGTIYVGVWTHTPENCPGTNPKYAKMLTEFNKTLVSRGEALGVKILGSYVNTTGHGYTFVVQSKNYEAVQKLFIPFPTQMQTGNFYPVMQMDQWVAIMNAPK